jgi:hypothetical protein
MLIFSTISNTHSIHVKKALQSVLVKFVFRLHLRTLLLMKDHHVRWVRNLSSIMQAKADCIKQMLLFRVLDSETNQRQLCPEHITLQQQKAMSLALTGTGLHTAIQSCVQNGRFLLES